ncbi:MAG: peptidase [Candidatus Liberibacter ctenarytainae]|uniref:Peptidase n=1 Tax=Candidatus Liberibacter ctenarytainae TaxID=2020335 RepID=A0A937AEL1_9HYPH|nr:peptidase [Candidatus Liberibacter ctenarytainae]
MKEDKMICSAIFLVVPFCFSVAALSDLFSATIPNRVSIVMLCSFLLIAPLMGLGFMSIALHLLVGCIVFSICLFCFAVNIMGGGDAKLLTTAAIWFGWDGSLLRFLLLVAIFGGVLAVVILLIRGIVRVIPLLSVFMPRSFWMHNKIPYGIAISIGGFIVYPDSYLFQIALSGIS